MRIFTGVLSKVAGSRALTLQAKSPTIFFVGGIVGVVAGTVLACRATLKLEETLEPFEGDDLNDIDSRRKIAAGIAVVKLYAPAIIIGSASVVMLTKSHGTLMKRNAALSAAYTALDQGFRDYRARVVEKYGPEEDDRLRYGFISEKPKTVDGKKVSMPDRVDTVTGASIYARFFDQMSRNWSKDPEYNKIFLNAQQNYLNNLLQSRGHVFLNEAYEALDLPHSRAGAVVGWILSENGDNYIDLGVFNNQANESVRDFVNGREGAVLLDFNVDGIIFDKIKDDEPAVRWQSSRWFRA